MCIEGLTATEARLKQTENLSRELYLELMKKCLTRIAFPDRYASIKEPRTAPKRVAWKIATRLLQPRGLDLVRRREFDPAIRTEGLDWPCEAETMVGMKRLDNLQACITDALEAGIPGDMIETGVWRGGASIFMRAILKAYGERERTVWLADSFQGLPKPNPKKYAADAGDTSWKYADLAVSAEEVKENFRKYELLDTQVQFLIGWFRDTLPVAPIDKVAVLRLDGDMYESTFEALTYLYPKLSRRGYAIIDDYAIPACQEAVEDYRARHRITEPLISIDHYAKFWQRLT